MTEDEHPTNNSMNLRQIAEMNTGARATVPGPLFPPELRQRPPGDACPHCNGSGTKSWGKLGIRKCIHCKGTGKARKR